jgi:(1->4)-alpha-D-glucan 1-alpha-D-glucosylmutase
MTGEADPEFIERIKQYMVKALREAKENTSWRKPAPDFESVLAAFVNQLLAEPWWPMLREEIRAYAGSLAWHGALNSLSQTLLKITCPGVPDFYQGTELWALTLVDPDNRRRVDYGERIMRLGRLEPLLARPSADGLAELWSDWRTGDIKLYLIAAALRFRRQRPDLYTRGGYQPLPSSGPAAQHVIAFARADEHDAAITIAPRLLSRLCPPGELPDPDVWAGSTVWLPKELAGRDWRNVLTGELHPESRALQLADVLRTMPLALLA